MTNFTSEASEIQENKWNLFPNSTTGELINILLHGYQEQRNRVHYLLPVALTSTSNAVSYSQWYTLHSIIWRQIRCDIAFIALLCNVTVEFGNKFHAHSQRWLAYGIYPCNNFAKWIGRGRWPWRYSSHWLPGRRNDVFLNGNILKKFFLDLILISTSRLCTCCFGDGWNAKRQIKQA